MIEVGYSDFFSYITFTRVAKKNALNKEMYLKMIDIFKYTAESKIIKALIIRAEGDFFCSGQDITEFIQNPQGFNEEHPLLIFLKLIESFPKFLIFVVEGHAVGIGVTMLLHGDFIIAQRGIKFSTPFVQMGLCAEAGSSQLLERIIGKPTAKEMLLLGREVSVEKLKGRLVNEITTTRPHTEALLTIVKKQILELPLSGILKNKDLMRHRNEPIEETMQREVDAFAYLLKSPETQNIIQRKLISLKKNISKNAL